MDSSPFAHVDAAAKRATGGIKWTRDGTDVLPAWVAEHDFRPPDEVLDALHRIAGTADVGYTRRFLELGPTYGLWARERHGWTIDSSLVHWHVDVLQGVMAAVLALTEPGGAVVVQTPVYFPFLDIAPSSGRVQIDWPMTYDDDGWHFSVEELDGILERAPDARVLVLSHPHNPTGRVMTPAELTSLLEVAAAHDVNIVSDEIHGDLVFSGTRFRPILTIEGAAERCVAVTSMGKTLSLSGLKCAISVFGDRDLRHRVGRAHPPLLLSYPGRAGIEATIAAWTHAGEWTDGLAAHCQKMRDHLAARLADEAPLVRFHPPESTFLAWLDVSACGLGPDPAAALLDRAGVSLSEGHTFGPGGEGHVRLNFGTSMALLDEIIDRLVPHLAPSGG
ncbi:MAG: MalY/PatB family protein [Acidimicrobiales bacterium]